MSYPPAPPPSGGVNPYGNQPQPEQAPGVPPVPPGSPTASPTWQVPTGQPPVAPSYGTPPTGPVPSYGTSSTGSPSYGTPPADAGTAYATPPTDAVQGYGTPSAGAVPGYGTPPTQYGPPTTGSYSPYQSAGLGSPGYGGWYTSTRDNGKATGALIVGIISMVVCWVPFVGLGLGIGAVVMGLQGQRAASGGTANNGGVAKGGMILGIIGIVLGALATLGLMVNATQQ